MADGSPKTKGLGSIPISALKDLDGWKDYHAKAKAFSEAKTAAEEAKKLVRRNLSHRIKAKNPDVDLSLGEIDFTIGDKDITVFQRLEKKEKRRGQELSI